MKLFYWCFLAGLMGCFSLSAQKLYKVEIKQAETIQIDAGQDTILCSGSQITLGGSPTARGGSGQLYYSWFPAELLDDPTSSNPVATIDSPIVFTVIVIDEMGCLNQDFVEIRADLCTGVEDMLTIEKVSIFPNPANDRVFIHCSMTGSSKPLSIKMFNCFGQLVQEDLVSMTYANVPIEWLLNNPKPGLYFIQLSCGDYSKVEKIQID